MEDPFGEFEQVAEQKVEAHEAPAAAAEEEEEAAPSWEEIAAALREDQREAAQTAHAQRQKLYARQQQKQRQIAGLMERLYLVRHDPARDMQEALEEVKRLLAELNRRNEELAQLTEQGLQKFSASLALDELGIARRVRTRSFRKPSRVDFAEGSQGGLARTGSTRSLEDKPAEEKWHGLFRMFREWKFQKQVQEAQHILDKTEQDSGKDPVSRAKLIAEEKTKLRAAIYQLRQRNKILTESERSLLRILQAKLRALNQASPE